ncbi:unnamed protein product [Brachionus calyciflorus]|uniref:Uncharacterized protein n=1 Tax=Brachionus calyciflorus TaxID=104777 RepID=A0A813RKK2_9BILA|nr:unnamed protein product [Brachionus calyciflorus]
MKLFILAFFGLATLVLAQQIDDTFCNLDNIVSDDGENIKIPSHNSSSRFQVSVEKNSNKNIFTEEIDEFYDGLSNIGISINTFEGQKIYTYSYYDQNELLLVSNDKCRVFKLNESYSLTPFYVINLPDGKEQIVSELGFLLLNPQIKIAYLGSKNKFVRGIPVREWQTCLYSKKDEATLKVTISYSNEKTWVPAVTLPGYESVPVQVKIDSKTKDGRYNTAYNVYTQFRPDLLIEEEDYFTRSGVYCPGRTSQKPLPKIPRYFSFILHTAESVLEADSLIGTLSVSRMEFDYDKKLFRFDYRKNGIRMTDIHDQNTGLRYAIDNYHRNCSIELLENVDIENSPIEFFKFDQDPPFEYVGQRRVRGINTDVWIAPRSAGKLNGTWEWHFMADGWIVQETSAVKANEPVLLIFNVNIPTPIGNKKAPIYFHVSNFDQTRIDLFDFDVSICENIPNQHIRFSITSDKYEIMKKNRASLREGLVLAIQEATRVNIIRFSRIETIFDNGVVYVLFTLLDRSTLGNNDPTNLKDAIKNLEAAITNSKLVVVFTDEKNEKYGISADSESLILLDERNGKYVYNYYESDKTIGYSGGSVAGFIIGFMILGLVLGLVAGIFLILKRQTSLSLPGPLSFFNPNFNSSA